MNAACCKPQHDILDRIISGRTIEKPYPQYKTIIRHKLTQMEALFKTWKTSRALYLDYFNNYSPEQLNTTPNGFSNNLIWNIGHVIVAQQALIYKGSNLN